jgi:hypothetical protein
MRLVIDSQEYKDHCMASYDNNTPCQGEAALRLLLAMVFCSSNACRRCSSSSWESVSRLQKSRFQDGSSLQRKPDCTVVRAAGADSRTRNASSNVSRCDSLSNGFPAALPRGKSLNKKRGTPQCSTISRAQPITTVAMPCASRRRAARLTVWWHTGQLATRTAASTSSSWQ